MIDLVQFLHANEIIPLLFTRGQIIGDDARIRWAFNGAHDIRSGQDLVRCLHDNGVSLFVGLSSIFPGVNNEMVGLPRGRYDDACRRCLKLAIAAGFNGSNPTRLAVEMPITNLNIAEMGVRDVLFQSCSISALAPMSTWSPVAR